MNLTNKARSLRKNQTDVEQLFIELDGGQHANRINYDYDDQRSLFLEQRGFKVIRFWNNDVIENTEGVLEAIHLAILEIAKRTE